MVVGHKNMDEHKGLKGGVGDVGRRRLVECALCVAGYLPHRRCGGSQTKNITLVQEGVVGPVNCLASVGRSS